MFVPTFFYIDEEEKTQGWNDALVSYRTLFTLVQQHMEQSNWGVPFIEGNSNMLLFSTQELPADVARAPTLVKVDRKQVHLQAGRLHHVIQEYITLSRFQQVGA